MFTFMHLQHRADLVVFLCDRCALETALFYVVLSHLSQIGGGIFNECDSETLSLHECCTVSTTGQFPDAQSSLTVTLPVLCF